jgi:hypothetical protein
MPLTGYFEPTALTATAITAACVAAKAAGGGTVWLGNGTYTGDVTITFDPSCVSIEGADAIVDYSARTGNFIALTADATGSFNYKRGLSHALRGWILRGNSASGSVGLYLNTPLGAHDNSTTFNVENFVIERFGVNLDIGANCYICTFRGISLGWCVDNQIRRLSFTNNGENMSFFGGQIFNGGGVALNLRGSNQEWRFFGVSFDYNRQIMYTDAPVVEFHGCHFESAWNNLSSLLNWQGVFEGDNSATIKFFGGEIGLTNTQLTNIDHFFKSWGTGGLYVEFYGCELPNSLHYKIALCNDMARIKEPRDRAESAKALSIDSKKVVYSDFRDGNNFKLLATSDFYLPNPTNSVDGQQGSYWFKQDATGNRKLLSIGDKFFGEPITLSTAPNYEDRLDYKVTDDNIEYTLVKRTNTMIAGSLTPIMLGQIQAGVDANTLLLLSFDGTNGSTTFTDDAPSPNTVTSNIGGSCYIGTGQSKFGGSSLFSDGSNGARLNVTTNTNTWLTIPNSGVTFTVEFWIYHLAADPTLDIYIGIRGNANSNNSWWELRRNISTGEFELSNGGSAVGFGSNISLNTWTHVCMTNDGTTIKGYLNGTQCPNTYSTYNIGASMGETLAILGRVAGSWLNPNAYMDELRISNVVRYTGNFTPPTAAF